MPSLSDILTRNVSQLAVRAVSLTLGSTCLVVGLRDLLLYLDSADLAMVGTTDGLIQVVVLLVVGWFCVLVGLVGVGSLDGGATA